ncbi:MAG: PadR family transcriptional regulator, partial [Longimicrobiales bacterium]
MKVDLLQGTLDMLVLKALSWGSMHGYEVTRWLEERSGDALRVEEGSLYPALHRLARRGLVRAEWGVSENNRRAKYYSLSARGRSQLEAQSRDWAEYARAIRRVLRTQDAGSSSPADG